MASSPSSSHQQNQRFNAFSEIEPASKRRRVSQSSRVYDVFINHRGPDVKATLATQLYNSLQQLGIDTFLDSEEKELGDSFPSIIETAIHSAKVHIAIFSPRYAESAWCLNELVLMLESTAKIIPIFYKVKPADLRYIETGVYAEAFIKYEEKGRYLEKLNAWKEALQSLSFTAGEEFNSFSDGDCQKIVASAQKEVQRKTCLHVADYPVGLNNLVEDFERRCLAELVQDFESQCGEEEGKRRSEVVGIFGMGGVGKTTLAKELFNRKGWKYRRTSFLFDVREKSVTGQLPLLQGKLIKDLFGKEISFTSTEEGTAYLKDRLGRSPLLSVLIVIDDINHVEQLNALAIMDILKNSGNSLVIVTTRDAGVLITAGITVGYNLRGMKSYYAKELFCWYAFRQAHPSSGYEVLVEDFVEMCGGLPLSLQVLGSHVRDRPQSYWGSELIKVSKTLPRDVKQRLLISFDALDDEEKQVFMDAACFFVGKPKIIAERVWDGSGWNTQHALETLKDKCLVEEIETLSLNIEGEIVLGMHDHLRDLGREMASQLSPPHRLWDPQDLKSLKLMGFKTILSKTNIRCFSSIFDESMGSQVAFFLGPSDSCLETSASLLWLQIEGTSEERPSIPSWIPLQKLHYLKIHLKQLETLRQIRIQAPLTELRISQSSFQKELPRLIGVSDILETVLLDAGGMPIQDLSILESLRMNLCSLCLKFSKLKGEQASTKRGERILSESLVIDNFKFNAEVDWNNGKASMSRLEKIEISHEESVSKIIICGIHCPSLVCIKLHYMKNLVEMELTRVNTLYLLDIGNCPRLKRLAATADLPNMRNSTLVSETPDLRNLAGPKVKDYRDLVMVDHFNSVSEVSSFRSMAQLKISECQELEELRLGHLSSLEKVTIQKCNNLRSVSELSNLAKLVKLKIADCKKLEFEYLCFRGMKCLESIIFKRSVVVEYFELEDCPNLKTMQFASEKLVQLSILGCPELKELPSFYSLDCLQRIVINGCWKLKLLRLYHCQNLKSVSWNFSVEELYISNCPELEESPDLSRMSSLEELDISECEKIQSIRLPTTLTRLCLQSCRDLRTVAGTGDCTGLKELSVRGYPELEEYLSRMSCLEELDISECEKIQSIRLPTTLTRLCLQSCGDLRTVAGIGDCTGLKELSVRGYPELEELPDLSRMSCLEELDISECEKIQSIRLPTTLTRLCLQSCGDLRTVAGIGDCTGLKELSVRGYPELEELPDLSRMSSLEELDIFECEKIQSIRLPTTLTHLYLQSCRDLRTVAGTGVTELWSIVTDSCEKLQNIEGMEELQPVRYIELVYCTNALIQNSVHKLKSLPYHMVLIGRAVDGAESSLNANLFHDVDVDGFDDIGPHEIFPMLSESKAVFVCFVVAVDSCSSARDINGSLDTIYGFGTDIEIKVREGEWVVTLAVCKYRLLYMIDQLLDILRRHGILKKGIWAGLKEDQMGKSMQVFFTIVDRLYHL